MPNWSRTVRSSSLRTICRAGRHSARWKCVKTARSSAIRIMYVFPNPDILTNGLKRKEAVKGIESIRLTTDKLYEDNTLDEPQNIVPVKAGFAPESMEATAKGTAMSTTIEPYCFTIYVIQR